MINPYNDRVSTVRLDRKAVTGFVFWTKNVGPFLKYLPEVQEKGFPFVVQHTINRYPRVLETSVVDADKSIESAWRVRELFGPKALVWRYDTIVTTSLTPEEFHIENFRALASRLEGATEEVVISFAQTYEKTKLNLDAAAQAGGFSWQDPSLEAKRRLLRVLVHEARLRKMNLTVCSQRDLLVEGSADAKCVDAQRLAELVGTTLRVQLKGNRKDCGCFESRDIGDYDTCPHGCVYCYAVKNRQLALDRYRKHNPDSDFLFEPPAPEEPPEGERGKTLSLFGD